MTLNRHVPSARPEGVEHDVITAYPFDFAFTEIERRKREPKKVCKVASAPKLRKGAAKTMKSLMRVTLCAGAKVASRDLGSPYRIVLTARKAKALIEEPARP